MANEEQANEARRQQGHTLMMQGVHALEVEAGGHYGMKGFVIIAHVTPGSNVQIPSSIEVPTKDGEVAVPIVMKRSEPFRPE